MAQLAAIREWGTIPAIGRYATLKKITHPTLIVHGNKNIVVAPINALILAEHLPNAQLIVYSDSSHGAQYQHYKVVPGAREAVPEWWRFPCTCASRWQVKILRHVCNRRDVLDEDN